MTEAPREQVAAPPDVTAAEEIEAVRAQCAAFRQMFERLQQEIGRIIVGQEAVVEDVLVSLFAGGHVLLEGVPGLGKTLLVRTLASALSLPFRRIQFTPDLMPADIVGTTVVMEDPGTGKRAWTFRKGPIFCSILLADEINRATPKSQSALLEAMQERSVTVGSQTHRLDEPFLVLATQNPIEQEGTYTLPEAQLDRFLFKLVVPFTTRKELRDIVKRTTVKETTEVEPIFDRDKILAGQRLVRRIVVAPQVQDYAIRLVLATHQDRPGGPALRQALRRLRRQPPRGPVAYSLRQGAGDDPRTIRRVLQRPGAVGPAGLAASHPAQLRSGGGQRQHG